MSKKGIGVHKLVESCIFTYSTKHLEKKDKVRFYYALKGRDGKSGIVKRTCIQHLGRTVLLVPKNSEHEISEFLEYWKCKYTKKEVLLKE